VFILLAHLGCGILLFTGLGPAAALWALALYLGRMLATTAIYHRLIAHSSYQAPRPVWWLGSLVAASAGQMGPSWWTAHHRHVVTAADPHTPLQPRRQIRRPSQDGGGGLEERPADGCKANLESFLDRFGPGVVMGSGGSTGGRRWRLQPHAHLAASANASSRWLEADGIDPAACLLLNPFPLHHVSGLLACDVIWVGGTSLSEDCAHQARQAGLPLAPCYGATETAAIVCALSPREFLASRAGCGPPLDQMGESAAPHLSIKSRDKNNTIPENLTERQT